MSTANRNLVHLKFEGPPVIEETGVDPNFISKAIPAFTNLITSLAVDPVDGEESVDARPMLLTRANVNSSAFRIQDQDPDTQESMTRFAELIDSLDHEDLEATEEAVADLSDQVFNDLKKFLNINGAAETTFEVQYGDSTTGMDEEQIKGILKMLRGMKKTELKEEGVAVKFIGYLPLQKKAELMRNGDRNVVTAKIHPKAYGLEDIIKRIEEERTVSMVTRQSDGGNANTTILAVTA